MRQIQLNLGKVPGLHGVDIKRSVLALAVLLLLAGVVLAQSMPSIDRWVIGGGGGHTENGNYSLDGTIGQAVAGVTGNAPYGLCTGFWCGAEAAVPPEGHPIYLPLVVRNS
jgi:hypothetical protein